MISSNLQSQLFSKIATWDILTANNLVWGHRCPMRITQLEVEVWAHCVYVHLPANPGPQSQSPRYQPLPFYVGLFGLHDGANARQS